MVLAGLITMIIGVGGILVSVIMEIKTKEPVFLILMKVFPTVFGVGAVLYGLGLL